MSIEDEKNHRKSTDFTKRTLNSRNIRVATEVGRRERCRQNSKENVKIIEKGKLVGNRPKFPTLTKKVSERQSFAFYEQIFK